MEIREKTDLNQQFKVMWIIWGAMMVSLLVYIFVCHFVGEEIRDSMKIDVDIKLLRNIFFVVAACELGVIYYIRKIMLGVRPAVSEITPVQHESELNRPSYSGKYLTAMVISLAIAESIGIYGLVLFFLGDSFQTLYLFMGISAVTMFYYRPKIEDIEQLEKGGTPV